MTGDDPHSSLDPAGVAPLFVFEIRTCRGVSLARNYRRLAPDSLIGSVGMALCGRGDGKMAPIGARKAALILEADQRRDMAQTQATVPDQRACMLEPTLLDMGQRRDTGAFSKQCMEMPRAEGTQRGHLLHSYLVGKMPIDPGIEALDIDTLNGSPGLRQRRERRKAGRLFLKMQIEGTQQQRGYLAMQGRKLLELAHQRGSKPIEPGRHEEEAWPLEQPLQALAVAYLPQCGQGNVEHQRAVATIPLVLVMVGTGDQAAAPTSDTVAHALDLEVRTTGGRQDQLMVGMVMGNVFLPQVAGTQVE